MTIPTKSSPLTTGTPEILWAWVKCNNSKIVVSGVTVIGSLTIPASYFFTRRTSAACAAISIFLWRIEIPPSCAMAMAIFASDTVSIAADIKGICKLIPRVSLVFKQTSLGRTVE